LTIPELADTLGITTRAVEKQIAGLHRQGRLRRVGPAKGGHWEVTLDDMKPNLPSIEEIERKLRRVEDE
jgi:predicted HTH transcriptional regulator